MPFSQAGRGVADDPGVRPHAGHGRRGRVDVRARPCGRAGRRNGWRGRPRSGIVGWTARSRSGRARRRRCRRGQGHRAPEPLRGPGAGRQGPLRRAGRRRADLGTGAPGRGRPVRPRCELTAVGRARAGLLLPLRRSFGHEDGPLAGSHRSGPGEQPQRRRAGQVVRRERRRPLRPPLLPRASSPAVRSRRLPDSSRSSTARSPASPASGRATRPSGFSRRCASRSTRSSKCWHRARERARHSSPGGRCVVLSYHSGEDRLVKQCFLRAASGGCVCPAGPAVRLRRRGHRPCPHPWRPSAERRRDCSRTRVRQAPGCGPRSAFPRGRPDGQRRPFGLDRCPGVAGPRAWDVATRRSGLGASRGSMSSSGAARRRDRFAAG